MLLACVKTQNGQMCAPWSVLLQSKTVVSAQLALTSDPHVWSTMRPYYVLVHLCFICDCARQRLIEPACKDAHCHKKQTVVVLVHVCACNLQNCHIV